MQYTVRPNMGASGAVVQDFHLKEDSGRPHSHVRILARTSLLLTDALLPLLQAPKLHGWVLVSFISPGPCLVSGSPGNW
jgi:hypothetical protein